MTTKATGNTQVQLPDPRSPMKDPLRLLPRALTKLYSLWASLTYPFASVGDKLSVHYNCDWRRSRAHRIKLGNSVLIMKDATIEVAAPPGHNGEPIIVVDDNAQIGYRCFVSGKNCIHIERDVIMAQSVLITDHGCGYEDGTRPIGEQGDTAGGRIRIGQGSWIGQGAAIVCTRGELVLGRNCVVGAKALVTRSFPPHSVIFGNPAQVIRHFDPRRNAWLLGGAQRAETAPTQWEHGAAFDLH
jgi:acetyltransferase-like isoleucine patch superfamily enzyme